jgi:6-phosphogluconate dehydrogenase
MTSALAYFEGFCSERMPTNLIQAQRDYFGAHT